MGIPASLNTLGRRFLHDQDPEQTYGLKVGRADRRAVAMIWRPATIDLQQPMDRARLHAGCLAHAIGRTACGGARKDSHPFAARMRRIELTIVVLPTPGHRDVGNGD